MVKYGSLTNPLFGMRKEIKRVARGGFDYVELGMEAPEGDPGMLWSRKEEVLRELRKSGLPVIAHTAWWMDLSSPYGEIRRSWVTVGKGCIDVARFFGASYVNFHSHAMGMMMKGAGRKKTLDAMAKSLRELVAYGKKHKISIMLENAGEAGEIRKFVDFKHVVDRVPGLFVHLDIGHAHIGGGMKGVERFVRSFGKRIAHVHISDNHGKSDEHLPLGKGNLDLKKTVKLLKSVHYNKTITFEIFTKNYGPDQIKSRKKFDAVWRGISTQTEKPIL